MSFTSSTDLLNNSARYLTSCSFALPAWARSVSLMLTVCRQGLNPETPEYRAPGLTSTRMVTPSGTALKAPASCIEFDKQIVGLCPDALTPKLILMKFSLSPSVTLVPGHNATFAITGLSCYHRRAFANNSNKDLYATDTLAPFMH